MNKIEKLIAELCPDGVEFNELGEVAVIKNGKDWKKLGIGNVPVYGTGGVMGYVNKSVYNKPTVLIPRKGSIENIFYLEIPFWNVDTIYYTEINTDILIPKFFYYFLKTVDLKKLDTGSGRPSLTQAILNKIIIPIPPLPIQQEIVNILDTFSALETKLKAELEAELVARKKQYEYYRDELLSVYDDVEYLSFDNVITSLRTGLNPRKNFKLNPLNSKNYYITVRELGGFDIRISDKTDRVDDAGLVLIQNRSKLRAGDILFSGTGTIGRTALVSESPTDWNIKEGIYAITPNPKIMNARFLIHLLHSEKIRRQILSQSDGSTVSSIPMATLRKVTIPVPPLPEQERIVSILDKFDSLVNDLSVGLPAEIAARKNQYQYYRNKLLTFKPVEKTHAG